MRADDYLYWRVSEGGTPFKTSMPPWKFMDEQTRWDMINYMRALGDGTAQPSSGAGGAPFDPTAQAAHQADILAEAVYQDIITQAEADTFSTATWRWNNIVLSILKCETAAILATLVKEQVITQVQVEAFADIHDRLGSSGLMPRG